MNTLVIGNGFDIEHGLPTKYIDFLNYLKFSESIYKISCGGESIFDGDEYSVQMRVTSIENQLKNDKKLQISQLLKDFFIETLKKKSDEKKCFSTNVRELVLANNLWYEYFKDIARKHKIAGENWVDFEAEIANVVKRLEAHEGKLVTGKIGIDDAASFMVDLASFMRDGEQVQGAYRKEYIIKLEKDLSLFVNCLDDYIGIINELPAKYISPSIRKIPYVSNVINFNYSDTYRRIYCSALKDEKIHFIHGKAGEGDRGLASNIVLGVDDNLQNGEENEDLDCIKFKKYYQRIYKRTGMRYKTFMQEDDHDGKHLYFFGHSLAATDGDIIKELIKHYDKVTIFYHDDQQYRDQIINLVRVLGKSQLIKDAENKIEFVQQLKREKR